MSSFDAAAVAAVDPAGLTGDILAMPDHIVDALWRAESAFLAAKGADRLVVCGMGGSAIGADLAVAALGKSAKKPVHVIRGYDLPAWVDERTAVLLSSYSGSTEETLSCLDQAKASGAALYGVSSGGPLSAAAHESGFPLIGLPGILQPRAAVAYGIVAVLEIAIVAGVIGSEIRADLNAAAERLRQLATEWGPESPEDSLPKRLARASEGRVVSVYGADLTASVAYRWRCQINENAKLPAADYELPEANHNEICAWDGAGELVQQAAWFLADADQNDRVRKRIQLTSEIAAEHGASVETIEVAGDSRIERLFAAVLLGDLTSLYMAVQRGVDPSPVPIIEGLKDSLGRPAS